MQREPYWDYMSRRLEEEEPMFNSLHLKLNDTEKLNMVTESDLMRKEISQLQEQVQNGYKKIKNLNEIINKQRDKIFRLEGQKQLEFEF
mgnify:FL=1